MSEFTKETLDKLREPFPASKVSFKVQTKPNEKGNSLVVAYIDARDVMERLDSVVGPDWSDRYEPSAVGGLVCYLTVGGVTRADVGDTDNENEPVKSAYSDAFKRAAVKFGIGRFLYDLPKMWGKAKPLGKSFILEDGELDRLRRIVDEAARGQKQPAQKQPTEQKKPGPVQPVVQRAEAPESEKSVKAERPYDPEILHGRVVEKAFKITDEIKKGERKFDPRLRQVLAAALGKIFPDEDDRHLITGWLADTNSTKSMSPAYVVALCQWLGVKDFNDKLDENSVLEALAAFELASPEKA